MASTKESGGYPILAGPRVNDHFECLELREERICLKESEMKNKKRWMCGLETVNNYAHVIEINE